MSGRRLCVADGYADQSKLFFERTNLVAFSITMSVVEQIDMNVLDGGADTIEIRDLSSTPVRVVNATVGAAARRKPSRCRGAQMPTACRSLRQQRATLISPACLRHPFDIARSNRHVDRQRQRRKRHAERVDDSGRARGFDAEWQCRSGYAGWRRGG